MKREIKKRETETTVITDDNVSGPVPVRTSVLSGLVPGFTYPGSARMDLDGNFEFRPYRRGGSEGHNMQLVKTGTLAGLGGCRWDILRGAHTLKISLTVRDFERLGMGELGVIMSELYARASQGMRHTFFQA